MRAAVGGLVATATFAKIACSRGSRRRTSWTSTPVASCSVAASAMRGRSAGTADHAGVDQGRETVRRHALRAQDRLAVRAQARRRRLLPDRRALEVDQRTPDGDATDGVV